MHFLDLTQPCLWTEFILESRWKRVLWVLENHGIWSLQVLKSPGKQYFTVCTNPALRRIRTELFYSIRLRVSIAAQTLCNYWLFCYNGIIYRLIAQLYWVQNQSCFFVVNTRTIQQHNPSSAKKNSNKDPPANAGGNGTRQKSHEQKAEEKWKVVVGKDSKPDCRVGAVTRQAAVEPVETSSQTPKSRKKRNRRNRDRAASAATLDFRSTSCSTVRDDNDERAKNHISETKSFHSSSNKEKPGATGVVCKQLGHVKSDHSQGATFSCQSSAGDSIPDSTTKHVTAKDSVKPATAASIYSGILHLAFSYINFNGDVAWFVKVTFYQILSIYSTTFQWWAHPSYCNLGFTAKDREREGEMMTTRWLELNECDSIEVRYAFCRLVDSVWTVAKSLMNSGKKLNIIHHCFQPSVLPTVSRVLYVGRWTIWFALHLTNL